MKKQFLAIILFSFFCFSFDKLGPNDVASDHEIVWAGIDFSESKLIGSDGFTDPHDIKNRFFASWNNLIMSESDKYDVKKFYKMDKVTNDLSVVTKRNETPDVDDLVVNNPYSFEDGQLEKIIKSYDLKEASQGTGLVYVVESFNKTEAIAVINVVFFDIATKKILWSQKYREKPGGFGLRNFWASTIYKTMKKSGQDYVKS